MHARRLLPLALGVTALLVLAGIASHGRPLSGSRGSGPTATFFDYVFTTIVLFAVVVLAVLVYSLASVKRGAAVPRRGRWHLFSSLLMLALSAAVAVLILHSKFEQRLRQLEQSAEDEQPAGDGGEAQAGRRTSRNARLRWDEVAIAAALLGGAAALLLAGRRTRRPPKPWRFRSREAVSAALDFSLDDLRERARPAPGDHRRVRADGACARDGGGLARTAVGGAVRVRRAGAARASTRAARRSRGSPRCSSGQSSASMSPGRR